MVDNTIFITFTVIYVLEAIVIIIGNAFTIFVFWSQRLYLRRTFFLLTNLAITDLLVGITEPIILATEKTPSGEAVIRAQEKRVENLSSALQLGCASASVLFLALISLERVYAVLWPLRHRVIGSRVYICSIIIMWTLGLCVFGLSILAIYNVMASVYFTVPVSSGLFVSLLVICGSYLTIRNRLHYAAPEMEVHNRRSTEHNLRLSRTFFIVIAFSLVFYLPAFSVYTIRAFCEPCISLTGVFIVKTLHLANSMVNPFVYSFRMPIFKDALRACWRKRRQNFEIRPVQAGSRILGRRGFFIPQMNHSVNSRDIASLQYESVQQRQNNTFVSVVSRL